MLLDTVVWHIQTITTCRCTYESDCKHSRMCKSSQVQLLVLATCSSFVSNCEYSWVHVYNDYAFLLARKQCITRVVWYSRATQVIHTSLLTWARAVLYEYWWNSGSYQRFTCVFKTCLSSFALVFATIRLCPLVLNSMEKFYHGKSVLFKSGPPTMTISGSQNWFPRIISGS